jgi:hypothetical protein
MKEETKCYCGHTTRCDCGPETLEEVAERLYPTDYGIKSKDIINIIKQDTFINGAKWQQEQMYSKEEVIDILMSMPVDSHTNIIEWFQQFKNK